jgi:molybdenum cofactor cytidylyltransferase
MISAIVLAAGLSTRMKAQKLLLPWGRTCVIGQVVATLKAAGMDEIVLVTGGLHEKLQEILKGSGLRFIYNQEYANGEMLTSIQVGLRALRREIEAAMIVLGDQPQIELSVVTDILNRFQSTRKAIIVPSYRMHRGHPWLLGKPYWQEVLSLKPPLTLREFLHDHEAAVDYLVVNSPSILQDLDTKDEYSKFKP